MTEDEVAMLLVAAIGKWVKVRLFDVDSGFTRLRIDSVEGNSFTSEGYSFPIHYVYHIELVEDE